MQKGYHVKAIRRSNKLPFFIPAVVFNHVEWIDGDILDTAVLETAMADVDAVIHSAAKVSFDEGERRSMFKTNIEICLSKS